MFRKWFNDFTGKITKQLSQSNLLVDFFNEKINIITINCGNSSNSNNLSYEVLKAFFDLFSKMNQVKGKLEEVTVKIELAAYHNLLNDSAMDEKYYMIECAPKELDGIESFWRLILTIDSEILAEEIVNFIVPFYTKPIYNRHNRISDFHEYQNQFLDNCQILISDILSEENWQENLPSVKKIRRIF